MEPEAMEIEAIVKKILFESWKHLLKAPDNDIRYEDTLMNLYGTRDYKLLGLPKTFQPMVVRMATIRTLGEELEVDEPPTLLQFQNAYARTQAVLDARHAAERASVAVTE
jgi:hypothetical protein